MPDFNRRSIKEQAFEQIKIVVIICLSVFYKHASAENVLRASKLVEDDYIIIVQCKFHYAE